MTKAARGMQPAIPCDQNFWQLASIQVVSSGILAFTLGGQLTATIGAGSAISSIAVGNLLVWLMSLAIVAMSVGRRTQSIENVKDYLGRWGGIVGALILVLAFILWITLQIEQSVSIAQLALREYVQVEPAIMVRIGIGFGISTALVSLGGINWIKHICTVSLPVVLLYFAYLVIFSNFKHPEFISWTPKLMPVMAVITSYLPGVVNLPTFFRHARSKPNAFLAITVIFILYSALSIYSIWIPIDDTISSLIAGRFPLLNIGVYFFVLAVLLTCGNLVNIYFASAGWETIVPMRRGTRDYLMIGLLGTMVYAFIQGVELTFRLENIFSGLIGCMGIALIASFLIKIVTATHRIRHFEKMINSLCWALGAIVVLIYQLNLGTSAAKSLTAGITTTAIAVLIFIFIEETAWSVAKIFNTRNLPDRK